MKLKSWHLLTLRTLKSFSIKNIDQIRLFFFNFVSRRGKFTDGKSLAKFGGFAILLTSSRNELNSIFTGVKRRAHTKLAPLLLPNNLPRLVLFFFFFLPFVSALLLSCRGTASWVFPPIRVCTIFFLSNSLNFLWDDLFIFSIMKKPFKFYAISCTLQRLFHLKPIGFFFSQAIIKLKLFKFNESHVLRP